MELTIDRLTKQYGARIAVDGISAVLTPGVYGLLGANGAGKTTLMRMLCGILTPTAGEVFCDGKNILDMGMDYRDILGYLPQDFGYYPDYRAWDFLMYIAALKGIPRETAKKRCKSLLEMTGLAGAGRKKIRAFSGGMRQRLGIAQALLNNPKILVLDEPTAGLDPKERIRFRNLLSDYARERIVLLSTHIVSDIEAAADKVFLMKKGRFLHQGTVEELTRQAEGKVWELRTGPKEAAFWEEKASVANLHREGEETVLRIVAERRPCPEALPCRATLEDLYLLCFPEEERTPLDGKHGAAGAPRLSDDRRRNRWN